MCARCPASRPYYPWPASRPAGGDLGPAPDLGRPDHGAAPPIRWFRVDPPKPRGLLAFRTDDRPKFLCDGR
jgi:hypothetical protein